MVLHHLPWSCGVVRPGDQGVEKTGRLKSGVAKMETEKGVEGRGRGNRLTLSQTIPLTIANSPSASVTSYPTTGGAQKSGSLVPSVLPLQQPYTRLWNW